MTPEPTTETPPSAPNLGELIECSLTALVNAPGVFAKLARRPAPRPSASILLALAWGAAFFALNLIHAAISNPLVLQNFAPWKIGAVGLLGLGVWTALALFGAVLVYGLGRMLGAGDFDRALLVAAITLTAAPVQALCSWFPMAWVAPTVIAAWILACGLSSLFKADPWASRGVCIVLAASVLALQYGAAMVVKKYTAAAQLAVAAAQAVPSAEQLAALQQQMQEIQTVADEADSDAQNAQSGQSSLDFLRGPDDSEAAPAAPAGPARQQQLAAMSAQGDAMSKSVIGMLDSMAPMLDNPAITRNMNAQQKSDHAELKQIIQQLKTNMAAGTAPSPQEQQAQMMKIQQLAMRMMSAGMAMPKGDQKR